MIKILIICEGNTCRSPMAEFILKDIIEKAGLTSLINIQSAGTNVKSGNFLNPKVDKILTENNISHAGNRQAESITNKNLEEFDYILAMTRTLRGNIQDLKHIDSQVRDRIRLFLESEDVKDPYGHSQEVYEETYQVIYKGCTKIFLQVRNKTKP